MNIRTLTVATLLVFSAAAANAEPRTLFEFTQPVSKDQWQVVNDGVMGGRSDGRFKLTQTGSMLFFGTLSLENNGGFASVRSRPRKLSLKDGDTVVARVKGDGRRYTLNLYVPSRQMAFSYRVAFNTLPDQWVEIRVPVRKFAATSFGRVVQNAAPVAAQRVDSIGFLLGDKRAGPFKLEIDWIKVQSSNGS